MQYVEIHFSWDTSWTSNLNTALDLNKSYLFNYQSLQWKELISPENKHVEYYFVIDKTTEVYILQFSICATLISIEENVMFEILEDKCIINIRVYKNENLKVVYVMNSRIGAL